MRMPASRQEGGWGWMWAFDAGPPATGANLAPGSRPVLESLTAPPGCPQPEADQVLEGTWVPGTDWL